MSNESPALTRRHDFVLFFDVKDGNPNGDPDAGNLPRLDPETNLGLVSDVCLKRKVRNYVELAKGSEQGYRIYMSDGAVLNRQNQEAWTALAIDPDKAKDFSKLPKKEADARSLTAWMCANFFDVRAFGAVMSTEVNTGQVRGPVQLAFARSIEPVLPLEIAITRSSVTNERDLEKGRTMGRKHIIPYGLYRAHGFVSASFASHRAKSTGFTDADLELLWTALTDMFEHDRSAARGQMATRALIVFEHASALGNAHADALFKRVRAWRKRPDQNFGEDGIGSPPGLDPASDGAGGASLHAIGSPAIDNWPPARSFADYALTVDEAGMPAGVTVHRM